MRTLIVFGLITLARVQGRFLSSAQYTCCGPDQVWEADEGFMVGSNAGGGTLTEGRARLSYDNTNQKVNMDMESTTNGKLTKYRILQHFQQNCLLSDIGWTSSRLSTTLTDRDEKGAKVFDTEGYQKTRQIKEAIHIRLQGEKIQYMILPSGVCTKSKIAYDFIASCVPANATKVLSSYYGSPDRPYKIEVYRTQILGMNAYLTVNPDPKDVNVCMPIGEVLYGQIGSSGKMENIAFTNYSKGLKDPTVFDIPPECKPTQPLKQGDVQIKRLRRSVFA